jgi:hypothetical protein
MKKLYLVLLTVSSGFFGFSCKKCLECSYRDPATLVTRSREECGNRETRDHFKQDVIKEAKAFGLEEKDVTCKEK